MRLRAGLSGGRRELRLEVGPYTVAVVEVPGRSLSEQEWHDILQARRSYVAMWGDACAETVAGDALDGRDGGPYETWHYLAWVRDGADPGRLLVMRKARLNAAALSERQRAEPGGLLPSDIRWWRVRTDAGCMPLWEPLRVHARKLAPDDEWADLRIAALGRVAAYPLGERRPSPRKRQRTAVAFAAIQLLAAHGDANLLWAWTLCPEFQHRVLMVTDADGMPVAPDFRRTEDVLGLPARSVELDGSLPEVRRHKATAPGYFIDNEDAGRLLDGLLDGGRLTIGDLRPVIARLVEGEAAAGATEVVEEVLALLTARDHARLAELLVRPRLCKYLTPIISGAHPLPGMSFAELQARLVGDTRDGPFSSLVVPVEWAASARAVLDAIDGRYAD